MEFLQAIIQTVIKLIIIGAFAFGGILLGRFLKNKKDKRKEEN